MARLFFAHNLPCFFLSFIILLELKERVDFNR